MNEIVKHEQRKPALAAGAKVSAIVPTSFDETYRIAQAIVASGMAPRGLNTPEKAMVAIMHGMEVGMTPMVSLQSIAVINGNPAIWGDGAIGLVRGSGHLEWIEETQTGQGDSLTAKCLVKRKGEAKPIEGLFSVAQAKKAGLWGKQGPWTQYPERMLKMRARAFALRDGFADILRGLSIREEVEDYPERASRSEPSSLQERLAARQHVDPVDDGFNENSINRQINGAQEDSTNDPDAIDADDEQPKPEGQKTSDNAPEEDLSDEQRGLLTEIEKSFSGCRTLVELDRELGKYKDDVEAGGDTFMAEANKLYFGRRAEIGGK